MNDWKTFDRRVDPEVEAAKKMTPVYFVDVDYNFENGYWQDGFTKAKIKDDKWLEIGSEEFQLFNASQTIPSLEGLSWTAPVAPTSEQIILNRWVRVYYKTNYYFVFFCYFEIIAINSSQHGPGNENHDTVWREYLTNPLLTQPIAWSGGIISSLPDNFFNEELYPTHDYNEIHQFIEQNVKIDGWMEKNEFIKTNLYRWNETHFRLGKQG